MPKQPKYLLKSQLTASDKRFILSVLEDAMNDPDISEEDQIKRTRAYNLLKNPKRGQGT